jgi:hypothetical protein
LARGHDVERLPYRGTRLGAGHLGEDFWKRERPLFNDRTLSEDYLTQHCTRAGGSDGGPSIPIMWEQ